MISWNFNKENGILEVTYSGHISIEEFINYGNTLKKDNSLPRVLKILTNAQNANYDIKKTEEKNQLIMKESLKQQLKAYTFVKNAVIHKKPVETAISYTFKEIFSFENYSQKTFYTQEAALRWLNHPLQKF